MCEPARPVQSLAHWRDLLGATASRSVRHHCPHRISVGGLTAVCELHHNERSLPATELFASSPAADWASSPPSENCRSVSSARRQRAEARRRGRSLRAEPAARELTRTTQRIMLIGGDVTGT